MSNRFRTYLVALTALLSAFVLVPSARADVTFGAPGCEFAVTFPQSPQMAVNDSSDFGQIFEAGVVRDAYRFRARCARLPIVKSGEEARTFMAVLVAVERIEVTSSEMTHSDTGLMFDVRGTRPALGVPARVEATEQRCAIGQRTFMCLTAWREQSLPASPKTAPFLTSLRVVPVSPDGRWTLIGEDAGVGSLYLDPRSRYESGDAVSMTLMRDLDKPFTVSTGTGRSIQAQVQITCGAEPTFRWVDMILYSGAMTSGIPVAVGNYPSEWTSAEGRYATVSTLLNQTCSAASRSQ